MTLKGEGNGMQEIEIEAIHTGCLIQRNFKQVLDRELSHEFATKLKLIVDALIEQQSRGRRGDGVSQCEGK